MTDRRFFARSASDKTSEWPLWFVADSYQANVNVTAQLRDLLCAPRPSLPGSILGNAFARQPFLAPWDAVCLAVRANKVLGTTPCAMWPAAAARVGAGT